MISLEVKYPDFKKYEDYINAQFNVNYVDKIKLDQTLSTYVSIQNTCKFLMNSQLGILESGYNKLGTSKDAVRQIFMKHGIPEKIFRTYTTKSGYTFNEEARTKLIEYLQTTELMNSSDFNIVNYMAMYDDLGEASAVVSSMRKNFDRGLVIPCKTENCYGYAKRPLYEMYNHYVRQITGRYYAREVPLVQLPLAVRKCITAPKNYFLLSMDLRQIDMRVAYNMYLRGFYPENDELFDMENDDKYKVMYQIICETAKIPYDIEWFTENRGNVKTAILAGMYLAQEAKLTQVVGNAEFAEAVRIYFDNHIGYQRVVAKIQKLYDMRIPFTIKDYFGFEIDIEVSRIPEYGETTSNKNDRYEFEEVVKLCVSRSIQSTSNSILINWLNTVMDTLRESGVDDSMLWISAIRHDEPVFCIHKSALSKLDPLFNGMKVQIADWGLIEFEAEVYLYYKENEETFDGESEILNNLKEIIQQYQDKLYPVIHKGERLANRCIPNVHEVYCFSLKPPSEMFGKTYNSKDDEEVSKIITEQAYKGNLPEIYEKYSELWNIFVVHNTITDSYRKFKGIEAIGELFNRYNIQYVRVFDVFGNGTEIYGNTVASCIDTEYKTTVKVLEAALEEIKEFEG